MLSSFIVSWYFLIGHILVVGLMVLLKNNLYKLLCDFYFVHRAFRVFNEEKNIMITTTPVCNETLLFWPCGKTLFEVENLLSPKNRERCRVKETTFSFHFTFLSWDHGSSNTNKSLILDSKPLPNAQPTCLLEKVESGNILRRYPMQY